MTISIAGGIETTSAGSALSGARTELSLDGLWQVGEGSMDEVPSTFDRQVAVPGLVDMAQPAFEEVGVKSDNRQGFWYRRTFEIEGAIPDVAVLRINKAKYGTKVWLNGHVVGEHLPCFTPAEMPVKRYLKGDDETNELIVRVGADRESLPEGMPTGWDFEKFRYIPGIYDSVSLILTGFPYMRNVQTVPNIQEHKVRVVVELEASDGRFAPLEYAVSEVATGKVVGTGRTHSTGRGEGDVKLADFEIQISHCRLWSPEAPFLYELKLKTSGDSRRVRFGMRSFGFDAETGRAMLNGKPYFMRGTNVCAYRFFEDTARGDRPWRKQWVRRLHRKFKGMNWNAIRYCIGFPPDFWYEIADEQGFLIQDEFPIWLLSEAPEEPKADRIVPEYTEWMRRRWNHPCVVIWDAQNESHTEETGKALSVVRDLDLSGRPWENGWAAPQNPGDCVESHPYLFIAMFNPKWGRADFQGLTDMPKISPVPNLTEAQRKLKVPIIINEYAWLWLNRDGTPTCLTANVYEKLLGPDSTTEQRRVLYAKYLAALTEFWRSHRECAGVLHFCGLGYSRAGDKPRPEGGATSDHFIDMEKLTFEPNFERYVRDAFSPIGLMIDYWGKAFPGGTKQDFDIVVINDLDMYWARTITLEILHDGKTIARNKQTPSLKPFGRQVVSIALDLPKEPGMYELVGSLRRSDGTVVRSVRDLEIAKP